MFRSVFNTFANRRHKRVFQVPAVDYAPFNNPIVEPESFHQFNEQQTFALVLDINIIAAVTTLLNGGRPAAVARLVVTVVIRMPVKRMFERWSLAHILKEIPKFVPTLAHFDPAPAVPIPAFASRIFTTLAHLLPNIIFVGM